VSALVLVLAGVAAAAALAVVVPRALLGRSQDRLAKRLLAETGSSLKLLTRAELCTGGA
jgi:hypothetical protein